VIVAHAVDKVEVDGDELAGIVDALDDRRELEPIAAQDEQDRRPAREGRLEVVVRDDRGTAWRGREASDEIRRRWRTVRPHDHGLIT
jgi:hypothetical protein